MPENGTRHSNKHLNVSSVFKMNKADKASVVKIDPLLLKEVESVISKEENRIKFANKKQFINIAVYELLSKIKNESKKQEK